MFPKTSGRVLSLGIVVVRGLLTNGSSDGRLVDAGCRILKHYIIFCIPLFPIVLSYISFLVVHVS